MKAIYIPNGPKNLKALFPNVDFNDVAEYFIEVNGSGYAAIATGPNNLIDSCSDKIRIHFLNYLGTIDAVNFHLKTLEHEPSSDQSEKPLGYPLNKSDHAINRFNVRSNDTYTAVTKDYREDQMPWLDELLDSPLAWMEWEGTQGQPDSYIPIVIIDNKSKKVKEEERYTYQLEIQFKLSVEKFIIRNG